MSLLSDANTIAEIIAKTDTDYRGNLLFEVAMLLELGSQYYSAKIIKESAIKYGIKE